MSCRILVVAPVIARAKHFERVLSSAGWAVAIATTDNDALAVARAGLCDVTVLDSREAGPDPFVLCRALKTTLAPVLVITAEAEPLDRLRALDAGADECLSAPAPDSILLLRLRSLVELANLHDEHRRWAALGRVAPPRACPSLKARVLVLDPEDRSRDRLAGILAREFAVDPLADLGHALRKASRGLYDVALVSQDWADFDGIAIARQLRFSLPHGSPRIVLLTNCNEVPMQLGDGCADDLLVRPIDRNEAVARVRVAWSKQCLSAALNRNAQRPEAIEGGSNDASGLPGSPDRSAA
jgi:two-component system, cell cycle response regulator